MEIQQRSSWPVVAQQSAVDINRNMRIIIELGIGEKLTRIFPDRPGRDITGTYESIFNPLYLNYNCMEPGDYMEVAPIEAEALYENNRPLLCFFSGPNRNVWFMIFPYFHQDDGPVESLSKSITKKQISEEILFGLSSIAALYTLNTSVSRIRIFCRK